MIKRLIKRFKQTDEEVTTYDNTNNNNYNDIDIEKLLIKDKRITQTEQTTTDTNGNTRTIKKEVIKITYNTLDKQEIISILKGE